MAFSDETDFLQASALRRGHGLRHTLIAYLTVALDVHLGLRLARSLGLSIAANWSSLTLASLTK